VALYDEAAQGLGTLDDLDATAVAAAGPEVALRLLRRAGLYRAGRVQVEALLRLVSSQQGSRTLDLGSGIVAERCYGRLRLGPPRQDPGDLAIPVTGGGRYPWGVGVVVVTLAEGATVPANLVLRNLRPGDRLRTPAGRRKLHDMLVDRKVPRSLRRRVPLLAVESEVLWVGWPGGGRPGRLAPGAEEPAELAVTYLVSDGNRW
jgi:tRNA(Ile)-lysidine synthase